MFEKTLAPATKDVLKKLQSQSWLSTFYLAGGTALALQYGHRQSIDLDFFTDKPIAVVPLIKKLEKVGTFEITNQENNTLEGILNGVKVSFMTFPYPAQHSFVNFQHTFKLAHPLDIGLMKLGAITGRNTKKDFIDLYFILQREKISLSNLISFLAKQFKAVTYDPYHLYKALVYFGEADSEPMPKMLEKTNWEQVKRFFKTAVALISKK